MVCLTEGSLHSFQQLVLIVTAAELSYDSGNGQRFLPVNLPSFVFPRPEYFKDMLPKLWPYSLDGAEEAIRSFFKIISVSISIHGSLQLIEAQVQEALVRIERKHGIVQVDRSDGAVKETSGTQLDDNG